MNKIQTSITTSKDAKSPKSHLLAQELQLIIPDSKISDSKSPYNNLIKIVEHHNRPLFLRFTNSNITIEFKIVDYKSLRDLRNKADPSSYLSPELVITNFKTDLSHKIMNLLIDIFPQDNIGNRVVVFDAKCDFIFFRMYRYKFAELSKCNMQDVGPHLTLRLRKIIENGETQVIDYRRIEYKDENVFL